MSKQITDRLLQFLPNKPYASKPKGDDGNIYLRVSSQRYALDQAYIQVNPPALCAWLIFDVDHGNILQYEDTFLPEPNWISISPNRQSYHIAYAINPVCTSVNARTKPLNYLAAIQRAYTLSLDADRGYTGLVTKNPFSDVWYTTFIHEKVFSLGELAEHVSLRDLPSTAEYNTALGRNTTLFETLRLWAYKQVKTCSSHKEFDAIVSQTAMEINNEFQYPMSHNETISIANSVSGWTWNHRFELNDIKNRGIMTAEGWIDSSMSIKKRQHEGALYTAEQRSDKTYNAVKAAYEKLLSTKQKPTQQRIANMVGMTRQYVAPHLKQIKESMREKPSIDAFPDIDF